MTRLPHLILLFIGCYAPSLRKVKVFTLALFLLPACTHTPPKREPEELPAHCRKLLPTGTVFCEVRK